MSEEFITPKALPYVSTWEHDHVGDVVLMADGSYGVAWEITPYDTLTFDEENILELEKQIYSLYASLPHGSFMLANDSDRKMAGAYFQLLNIREDNFTQELTRIRDVLKVQQGLVGDALRENIDQLRLESLHGSFVRRKLYLLMRYYPEQSKSKGAAGLFSFLQYSISPSGIAELVSGRRLKQLENDLSIVEGVMAQNSLAPQRLNSHALRKLLYHFFNPSSKIDTVPYDYSHTLRSQVMGDLLPGHHVFQLDGVWHSIVSLRSLPSSIYSCSGSMFQVADGDVIMNFALHPPEITRARFKSQARKMKVSAVTDNLARLGKKEIVDAEAHLDAGINFGIASWHILLRDEDIDALRLKVASTLTLFGRVDGIEGKPERRAAPSIFFSCCVPWASSIPFERLSYRQKTCELPWITNLSPLFGSFSGTASRPVLVTATHHNPPSIFTFDPFDESQINWNAMVIGKSGSGKSTFLIRLFMSFIVYNPIIFIEDKGGSYANFVEFAGGKHYNISTSTPYCINVFDISHIDQDNKKQINEAVSFAIRFMDILIQDMNQEEYALVSVVVRSMFDKQAVFYISNLVDELEKEGDVGISLAKRLRLYSKRGAYGNFFDGDTTLTLTQVVSIDLEGIYDDPRLLPAYFIAIEKLKRDYLSEHPTQKHIHLYDEVWKAFKNKVCREILEEKNRVIRKEFGGGAVWYADQLVETYLEHKETTKILRQTTNWFVLQMETSDIHNLTQAGFTNREQEIISKLETVPGQYSTTYARHVNKGLPRGAVMHNAPTPLIYAIMTNDGDDRAVIRLLAKEYAQAGENEKDALHKALRDFAAILPMGCRPIAAQIKQMQEKYPDDDMLAIIRRIISGSQ